MQIVYYAYLKGEEKLPPNTFLVCSYAALTCRIPLTARSFSSLLFYCVCLTVAYPQIQHYIPGAGGPAIYQPHQYSAAAHPPLPPSSSSPLPAYPPLHAPARPPTLSTRSFRRRPRAPLLSRLLLRPPPSLLLLCPPEPRFSMGGQERLPPTCLLHPQDLQVQSLNPSQCLPHREQVCTSSASLTHTLPGVQTLYNSGNGSCLCL